MTITVLTATDYSFTNSEGKTYSVGKNTQFFVKQFSSEGKKAANNAHLFEYSGSFKPPNLEKAYHKLLELEKDPKSFVIRFEYKDIPPDKKVARKSEFLNLNGTTNLLSLDIDELEMPKNIEATDIARQGKYVIELLSQHMPEWFEPSCGFIAQASASAGLVQGKIKLHLWLWNSSAISVGQMKHAFSKFNEKLKLIDLALYSPGQPHFTGKPIFKGVKDPFSRYARTVYVPGAYAEIPHDIESYSAPVRITEIQVNEYTESIVGGLKKSKHLEAAIDTIKNWDINTQGLRTKVIAAMHQAIQDCYNLELLEAELFPVLNHLRTGKAQDYLTQGKNAAVANITKLSSRALGPETCGVAVSEISGGKHARFLSLNESFPKHSLTFLRASLGTGKTHTIQRLLESGKITGKFLAITDTSALVESNAKRFNAVDFRDRDGLADFYAGKVDRLSGTIHSLQLLEENTESFDFIFIDEADSVLNTLLFASIIEEGKRYKLIEVLADILRRGNRIVLSDGDLSQETMDCYFTLIEGCKKPVKIVHQRKNLKDVNAFRHITPNSLWGSLFAELSAGKKCLLVSDCSPDSLNTYYKMLERELPTKHIEVVHATSKMDPKVRDIVNNTTDALNRHNIDALLCSPSITNGVDFNYFDTVFVLTTSENHSPNMRFQALMRERQPKEIHFYCKPLRGYETGYSSLSVDKGWISTSRKKLALRKEREFKAYASTFNYYLVQAGCKIITVNKPCECPLMPEDTDAFELERALAIITATELFSAKRHDDAYEMQKMIKAMLEVEELTVKNVLGFLEFKWHKKMEFLSKVIDDYWHVLKKNDTVALRNELKKSGHKFHLLTSISLKSNTAKAILAKCGILDDITETARMYIRYCNHTGLKISEQIKDSMEAILELKH